MENLFLKIYERHTRKQEKCSDERAKNDGTVKHEKKRKFKRKSGKKAPCPSFPYFRPFLCGGNLNFSFDDEI